jgi:glucose-6-phosphate isomerase
MDVHFKTAPVDQNMPLRLAMLSVWNNWGLDTCVSGLYPYSQALAQLPFHWQQLSMESLGKRSSHEGSTCDYRTGNVWLGGTGTQVQHTFFQMLHQGTLRFWSLFMCVRQMQGDARAIAQLQRACVSQANALALGATQEELYRYFGEAAAQTNESALGNRRFVGNQSSSILTLPDVSAISLGKLMALLEHWVVSESILMDLNPFDQFGVELGKVLAKQAVGDEADLNSHMTSVFMEQMCR